MAHRTSIELDEELLEGTRRVLGTTGIRETVEGAMREVIRAHRRTLLLERIRTGAGVDRSRSVLRASRPAR
jgi:Arc/MetJ family transcription regulator